MLWGALSYDGFLNDTNGACKCILMFLVRLQSASLYAL